MASRRVGRWNDRLLHWLARGAFLPGGGQLDLRSVARVVDRITDDEELAARLDALDEESARLEFLRLYEEESDRDDA